MNRAMFSGVAGLKTHQTKMDVIGNNIANVNTYGFKSQRAVFSDIYYQTIRNASAGTPNRGGQNPSSVGYGSTLAGVQTQMSQSSMQNTGFGMDVAITGEGFLQVMDPDGNIFYTKAGLLDYDSNGYLTDINGNFVLGAATSDGAPSTQKIRLDNIGAVDPKKPSVIEDINGIKYTVTASNATKYGNVSLSIGSSSELPAGLKATATISNTGAISVQLNASEQFSSMTELNNVINAAIKEANGGKEHAAGVISITADENKFGVDAVPGSFTGSAFGEGAKITLGAAAFGGKLNIKSFSPQAAAGSVPDAAAVQFTTTAQPGTTPQQYTISTTVNGIAYSAANLTATSDWPVTLKSADGTGSIVLGVKNGETFGAADFANAVATPATGTTSAPKFFLGGASIKGVSKDFPYSGNVTFAATGFDAGTHAFSLTATINGKTYSLTAGTTAQPGSIVTLKTADAADGTISVAIPSVADMAKNLGLSQADANFNATLNTALGASVGSHTYKLTAAQAGKTMPLTGAEIAGTNFGVKPGTITGDVADGFFGGGLTFMKTSTDFKGSGTVSGTQFTGTYTAAVGDNKAYWTVKMNVGGTEYSAQISEGTVASSLLMKGPDGDYIQVTNPGFKGMTDYFRTKQTPARDPADGESVQAMDGTKQITVSPATPSREMGLSSKPFALAGGTEGGVVTLDQLSSISIGADGTVSVTHSEKGTVVAGKISLASFANPSGLSLQGSNYYISTPNSGAPKLCDPGSDGTGSLKSSALEMSNVDLSGEFAEMITTQRGFQANSRIITVSDTMLEELINLKR